MLCANVCILKESEYIHKYYKKELLKLKSNCLKLYGMFNHYHYIPSTHDHDNHAKH